MGKLKDWMEKNANLKDGANFAEFEELEANETFGAVQTKEQAIDILKRYPRFESAFDSLVSKRVNDYEKDTFNVKRLPEIEKRIREQIESELNPAKTPEQKRLEELEAKLKANEEKERLRMVEDSLVKQAKELGYDDPEAARRYVAYGEKAEDMLKADLERIQKAVQAKVESEIKQRYGNIKPPQQSQTDPSKQVTRSQFDQLSPENRSSFIKDGGSVVED
jgi:hypothetical protein